MLSENDENKINDLNAKNHYGISASVLKKLILQHKKARAENDYYNMEAIEYRLTDINFHSECGLLSKGKYGEALKSLKSF